MLPSMFALTGVAKSFGRTRAVAPLDLHIAPHQTIVLIGPSGCGKSTLLRLMIGLISPDQGVVTFDDQALSAGNLRTLRHRMGYVIQEGGLFPHLTARGNIALMAQHLGWPADRTAARVAELAELTHFPPDALDRYPAQLSGGQRQRVSLMRALLLDPAALLLDEPLGALDPMIRSRLQQDLREIFRTLNKTVVMVTHDLAEAAFFADTIMLMRDGRIVQQGTYRDLVERPADDFVHEFVQAQHGHALTAPAAENPNETQPGDDPPQHGPGDSAGNTPLVASTEAAPPPNGGVHAAGRASRYGGGRLLARLLILAAIPLSVAVWATGCKTDALRVGSKKFTESVILGEILTQLIESEGLPAQHRAELGGTQILWRALLTGEIDLYPDYTGTLLQETLRNLNLRNDAELTAALAERGLRMTPPLGFENNYALGMNKARAAELGIARISDLRRYPSLVLRFSNEFMRRGDGWPGLQQTYQLPQENVRGIDHDLSYRLLGSGEIDAMELYTTDAEIAYYDLAVLEDDLEYFPRYSAVVLYRADLVERAPRAVAALQRLERLLSEPDMIALNAAAKLERTPEPLVAARFLRESFGIEPAVELETRRDQLARLTREHLGLVIKSLLAAILVAVPLGVFAAKTPALQQVVLGIVGIIQTIPALALLVLVMPPLSQLGATEIEWLRPIVERLEISGLGEWPAIVALFLYSLLPIVRNTTTGLQGISHPLRESSLALGLSPLARWRRIELPLASRTILAGIKTAAVINVGFATLGALIGAGGYGEPILTGIRLDDTGLILLGAIPAALLALLVQGYFELAERLIVPKGLRLKAAR